MASTGNETINSQQQLRFVSILRNLTSTNDISISQYSAILQLQTVESVIALGSDINTTKSLLDITSRITSKTTLESGEVLNPTLSFSVLNILSGVVEKISFSNGKIADATTSTSVMANLNVLGNLQVASRVPGEALLKLESKVSSFLTIFLIL